MDDEKFIEACDSRIKQHREEAKKFLDEVPSLEKQLQTEKDQLKIASLHYQISEKYFFAFVRIDFIKWEIDALERDKVLPAEELEKRKKDYKIQVISLNNKSAAHLKEAASIFKSLKKREVALDLYGKASKRYYEIFKYQDVKKIEEETLKTHFFSGYPPINDIRDMLSQAEFIISDLALELEESGKSKDASMFYSMAGDIHINQCLLLKKLESTVFVGPTDVNDELLYAAKLYEKAFELNQKTGSPIIHYAHIGWEYNVDGFSDFFRREDGYHYADDKQRYEFLVKKYKLDIGKEEKKIQKEVEDESFEWDEDWQREKYDEIKLEVLRRYGGNYNISRLKRTLSLLFKIKSYTNRNLNAFLRHVKNDMKYATERAFSEFFDMMVTMNSEGKNRYYKEVKVSEGFVDGILFDVPIELKLEKTNGDLQKILENSLPQITQYTNGLGEKIAILVIMDVKDKTNPIPHPLQDIQILTPTTESSFGKKVPNIIIGVILRTNVSSPSSM